MPGFFLSFCVNSVGFGEGGREVLDLVYADVSDAVAWFHCFFLSVLILWRLGLGEGRVGGCAVLWWA